METSRKIGALVLAAGASSRMGSNKALLPIDGKPMLLGVVEILAAFDPIAVVTGHDREAVERLLHSANVELLFNENHSKGGMLSSVKVGLTVFRRRADAVFIVLGDQPLVKATTLQQLVSKWRESRAAAVRPIYQGRHGHPILIDARSIDAILALPSDATLNTFIAPNSVDVVVDDPATIHDIDTPADYQAVTSRPSPRGP